MSSIINNIGNGIPSFFKTMVLQAIIVLLISLILSAIIIYAKVYFNFEDDSFGGQLFDKLSEGFVFIGSAALTGVILGIFALLREQTNQEIKPSVNINGMSYDRVITYVPTKQGVELA